MTRTVAISQLGDWLARGWNVVSWGNSDTVLIWKAMPGVRRG